MELYEVTIAYLTVRSGRANAASPLERLGDMLSRRDNQVPATRLRNSQQSGLSDTIVYGVAELLQVGDRPFHDLTLIVERS